MDARRLAVRTAAVLPISILIACTEQDAAAAGEGFLTWILILLFIGVLAFVLWALVLAGGIAALIAGWRRLNRPSQSSAPPPTPRPTQQTPASPPPLPGDEPERPGEPAPQLPPAGRSAADPVAILLIVFGVILVMSAGPIVLFGGNGDSRGWFDFSVPAPMLIVAGVLVWFGVSRSKRR
jgi:hypothetical protein